MADQPTDKEVDEAKRVLWRDYYSTVWSLTRDLVHEYFAGDFGGDFGGGAEGAIDDRLVELCDGALVYTKDQYNAVFSSENSSEALDELDGMGGVGDSLSERLLGAWSVTCLTMDVRAALQRSDLLTPTLWESMSSDEGRRWLLEEHGRFLFRISGKRYYLVGELNKGQTDEVSLGVVVVTDGDETELMGAYELTKQLTGGQPLNPTLRALLDAAEAGQGVRPLIDALMESGALQNATFNAEPEEPKDEPEHITNERPNDARRQEWLQQRGARVYDDDAGEVMVEGPASYVFDNLVEIGVLEGDSVARAIRQFRELGVDEGFPLRAGGRNFIIERAHDPLPGTRVPRTQAQRDRRHSEDLGDENFLRITEVDTDEAWEARLWEFLRDNLDTLTDEQVDELRAQEIGDAMEIGGRGAPLFRVERIELPEGMV